MVPCKLLFAFSIKQYFQKGDKHKYFVCLLLSSSRTLRFIWSPSGGAQTLETTGPNHFPLQGTVQIKLTIFPSNYVCVVLNYKNWVGATHFNNCAEWETRNNVSNEGFHTDIWGTLDDMTWIFTVSVINSCMMLLTVNCWWIVSPSTFMFRPAGVPGTNQPGNVPQWWSVYCTSTPPHFVVFTGYFADCCIGAKDVHLKFFDLLSGERNSDSDDWSSNQPGPLFLYF